MSQEFPMRCYHACCLVFLFLANPARPAEPQGRIVQDIWNAAYLEGSKSGYVHTNVRELERDGKKFYLAVTKLSLAIKRNGVTIQLRMDTGTEETPEGQVTAVSMRQYQGDQQQLVLTGTVNLDHLDVKIEGIGQPQKKKIPWDKRVIGLYRQERLFRDHKVQPGDQFSFQSYEPIVDRVVSNEVTVKDFEEIEVFKAPRRLLRVETVPEKSLPLPGLTTWLDQDLRPVRSECEIPQFGKLVLYRCSREEAQRYEVPVNLPDIFKTSLIRLNRPISVPNETRSAVYRITVKEDEDPASTFVQDSRQECKNVRGNTFELHVRATGPAPALAAQPKVKDEFLRSCYWIDSDDPRIKAYARQAVGKRTDPWERAQAIERWVKQHVQLSYSEPFAPASQVARTLRGDCRQYGLLATAMCRAVDVPARTAIGLCYAYDQTRGPVMAFHLWTEVFVRGEWVGIDATRGEGHVGATHLKITDSSWRDTQSLAPLLPVLRVLGKLAIEVVRVEGPG
jgi:hypothetical protein